jgi:RNA polymerase sigma-70 factor, ECF subfamily
MHERTADDTMTVSPSGTAGGERASDEDRALFGAFLRGDDGSLVALYDRHNDRLFRYCLQQVGTIDRAKDITQELWERVLKMRTIAGTSAENPLGLLFRIVRNLCIDEQRRRRGHLSLETIAEEHHPIVTARELSHLEELVILALPHLPSDQREIITLHEYSGYSYEEVAVMLGETPGTVRMRAWRGRAHLGRLVAAMLGMREAGDESDRRGRPEDER